PPVQVLLLPVIVTVPGPFFITRPEPLMAPESVSTALGFDVPPVRALPESSTPPALPTVTAPAKEFWLPVPLSPQIVPPLSVQSLFMTLLVLKNPSAAPVATVMLFVGSPIELVLVWKLSWP